VVLALGALNLGRWGGAVVRGLRADRLAAQQPPWLGFAALAASPPSSPATRPAGST